ncbi:O-antigen ligase family protein [Hymenobacter fodinae]|uniref:O-antigen ligase family protein n=2 Tax=Hymenobacter fodinae TaxID=2510796 RepID=A0A4Z0PC43_9BACT|nr:O-antigen ligase family protein [Hymenobacter fodinae]
MKMTPSFSQNLLNSRWLLPAAVLGALGAGWLAGMAGPVIPGVLLGLPLLVFFLYLVFHSPRSGMVAYVLYCFILGFIGRHVVTNIPLGLGMDAVLLLTWLAVLLRPEEVEWKRIQNDICLLALLWFIINVLQLANPSGASTTGWFYEMRSLTLYWVLAVPLGFLVFNTQRDLRLFLILVIGLSVLGALYGMKQKFIGLDAAEQQWLDAGQYRTHLIWGKLRVFSYYSEAAQFGASQAEIGLVCLVLALGPFTWWKRILFAVASGLLFYGMLISGTRGAMFVVATGIFVYLALSKQIKILILGCLVAGAGFGLLKYTSVGSSNADIVRLRSSLDPEDPSFQLRLSNQLKLRKFLEDKPFGEGVGTIGRWGHEFNPNKYISTIEPDSLYVKIWAEYGIVGFIIWFGMMVYILGKCCGIVWRIRDPLLRQKLLALTAGYSGILVASYGNEVMNQIPSAMIIYLSWVFVFLGPELDTPPSTAVVKHV